MSHYVGGRVAPQLGIYYEPPEWFKPLFAELDRRGVPYERLVAHRHHFDPAMRECRFALVVNRMSPSAYTRARVINHPTQAPAAAAGLTFPVIVKPNIGGSGAKIVRFDTPDDLAVAA